MQEEKKSVWKRMNESGLRIPLLHDHDKKRGSYTLTMFVISFAAGLILLSGKALEYFGEVDYSNVLMLIGLMGGFYTGKDFYTMVNGKKFGTGKPEAEQEKPRRREKEEESEGAEPPV